MEMFEAIDQIRLAIRKTGVICECPALLLQARDCMGHRDRSLELFEHKEDQCPVRPWAAMRDIEMISSCLCLEVRRVVSGDSVAKSTISTPKIAAAADLLRKLLIA